MLTRGWVSNIRIAGQMQPMEALYPAHMIVGLSKHCLQLLNYKVIHCHKWHCCMDSNSMRTQSSFGPSVSAVLVYLLKGRPTLWSVLELHFLYAHLCLGAGKEKWKAALGGEEHQARKRQINRCEKGKCCCCIFFMQASLSSALLMLKLCRVPFSC